MPKIPISIRAVNPGNSPTTHNFSTQLGLFEFEQSNQRQSDLVVDRVPERLLLNDDRPFYICVDGWCAGIQLSRDEAYAAIALCGERRDPAAVYSAIEETIDGGVA